MSTPGIRRALRALGRAKSANTRRLARGQNPRIGGKTVSKATFRKKTGASTSQAKAKQRVKARRRK